jgi:PAS domain S-box-containing protein
MLSILFPLINKRNFPLTGIYRKPPMSLSWKNFSITTKFISGFTFLLLLLVAITITSYLTLGHVREAEKTIQVSTKIQGMILEMEWNTEKARRLHGDFFLQYPGIGFTRAYNLYARQSEQHITDVIQISTKLQQILSATKVSNILQKDKINLNIYLSSAQRFADTSRESVKLIKELADPDDGLEAGFENTTLALQHETAENNNLREPFEKMVSFSKDYLLDRQRFSMQLAFNMLTILRRTIGNDTTLQVIHKQRMQFLLTQWQEIAEKILAIDVKIQSKFKDFALQEETIDPISTMLITQAQQDVDRAQQKITRAHRLAAIILATITIVSLFFAVIIALIFNNTITTKVVKLTQKAEKLQQGSLDVTADEDCTDELGKLAHTFNVMAARIKELVDNLEQKVDERTAELALSEQRFKAIVENTTQGILIIESKTMKFLYANPAMITMLGYSEGAELTGKGVVDIHPEQYLQDIKASFMKAVEGKIQFISGIPCLRKDGTTFYADVARGEVQYAGRPCLVGFFMDTTETRSLQDQLERARKMEAIGLLAGGVAHDLNNILSGIVSYPELILLQLPPDSALKRPLYAIHESGKRAAAVVSDLLTVARGVASVMEVTDLNSLILEYLESPEHLEIQLSHVHVDCKKDLDPSLAHISCSPVHIKKCILNLIMNAMEAIENEGSITLSTRNQRVDEESGNKIGIKHGQYVVLSISDTGHGIQEKDLEHIFEPFYTKKVMGKSGTGLGLTVVWNSVQDHGGNIVVESNRQGTAFHLFFPATNQEIIEKNDRTTFETFRGNGESILVVDDEDQQLDIARRILQALNYDAYCVNSGEEAIAYMQKKSADLVLLDMIMDPGINGLQTLQQILQLHPGQKTLIVSGFAESENVHMAQNLGAQGYIKKPYSIKQLGQVIKKELQQKTTAWDSSLSS